LPVFEYFRHADLRIVSDACVACRGPVQSVKLFFRVPPARVRSLDLDEGSRTSAALARVLLLRHFGLRPTLGILPIGSGVADSTADAVLLIGDRAMFDVDESFVEAWDLGEKWWQYTGLPFVFAAWVARPNVDVTRVALQLTAARDRGLNRIDAIAERESEILRVSVEDASDYLRNKLCYRLEYAERCGLVSFHDLCVEFGLTQPHPDIHAEGMKRDAYSFVG
jgi:chorismate dehydratase